jgi:hypothetical protein
MQIEQMAINLKNKFIPVEVSWRNVPITAGGIEEE